MEGLTRQMLTLVGASASYGHIRADDARRNGGMTALESAWLVRDAAWPFVSGTPTCLCV